MKREHWARIRIWEDLCFYFELKTEYQQQHVHGASGLGIKGQVHSFLSLKTILRGPNEYWNRVHWL